MTAGAPAGVNSRVTDMGIVVATRNRCQSLARTLSCISSLKERPPIVVVDNSSTDETCRMVEEQFPAVKLVSLSQNLGGAARTIGIRALELPYVAFADDDSWWAPGALEHAARLFKIYPRMGLLAARVLVGQEQRPDPVCDAMAHSDLPIQPDLPGRPVLGFIACGAIVRRSAYLRHQGFDPRFGIGGEEELLAIDLAASGWGLAYVDDIVAHHHPSPARDPARRRRVQLRNALWTAWLRRPWPAAVRRTAGLMAEEGISNASTWSGLLEAAGALPWVLRNRKVVPPHVEQALRILDKGRSAANARSRQRAEG
jgi:GT2 family glycosyltransferase